LNDEYGGFFLYPNRKIEEQDLLKLFLKGEMGRGRMMERLILPDIYPKCICKYHKVCPCATTVC
jgi:hypothetical protein